MKRLVLATRKSPLARAQTDLVAAHLRAALGLETEVLPMATTGDRQSEWSLEKRGGKGLFTTELEEAVRGGGADLAVHSAKDLPGVMSEGLALAGYLPRADPRDVLVRRAGLAAPASIATGSPRRRLQALRLLPQARFCEIRGNVDTRLRKIAEQGLADASILAAAGLARLGIAGWPGLEFEPLGFERMVPAVGQGAIAVQCRSAELPRWSGLFDRATAEAVSLERALQALLGAGCQTAFAAHAAADRLHFFHERSGPLHWKLGPGEFADPMSAARRFLREAGLSPA